MADGTALPDCRPDWLNIGDLMARGWSLFPLKPRSKIPAVRWEEYQRRLPRIDELTFHNVSISVVPDLVLRDGARTKLIKLQFGGPKLHDQSVKVITQCLLEAAISKGYELGPSSAIYIDLPRDVAHTAARAGKRTLRDIRAGAA